MKKILISLSVLLPISALAYSTSVDDVFDYFLILLNYAVGLLSTLSVVYFFYALVMFIWKTREGKDDVSKSKDMLIWSGVAMFMMVGIWSIVGYVQSSVGVNIVDSNLIETPILPGIPR